MNVDPNNKPSRYSRRRAIRLGTTGIAGLATLAEHLGAAAVTAPQATAVQARPVGQVQRAARPEDKLRIATCQFPVNASIAANATSIREFMRHAADAGAHLLHTSEASLSGYPGTDIPSFQEPYSHWASFIARPDATIPKQLERNQPGILIHDFPDGLSEGGWYHNFQPMKLRPDEIMTWGTPSQHPRQVDGQAEP